MPHLDLLFVAAYPTSFFTSPTEFAATAIAHGARLFAANCVVCHGVEARGDGPAARSLPLAPADLTADHFRAHSDGELYWFISHGFATPEGAVTMPGFAGVLSSEAIWHLIDYLRAHNAGDALRRTGSWPQPLPMPQFDAQCANGQIIDLDDLRGRALRIIAVSDDERPAPPLPDDVGAVTVLVARNLAARPTGAACVASEPEVWTALAIIVGLSPDALAGTQVLVDRNGWLRAAWRPGDAEDWTDPRIVAARISRHSRPSACHRSVRGARAPSLMVVAHALPRRLVRHLPFFYGWIILFCACCAGFSRQGGAVATLSIFVEPMTRDFGWSRTALSGAVSLGGVLAALSAPTLGRMLDRSGARVVLCLAVLTTGAANMLLSLTGSLPMFYLLFCVARTNFAGPFDLGIYGAVNNWFVARRTLAIAIATLAQMAGLVSLPLIAQAAIERSGWRAGWLAVGIAVLVIGFIPSFLFMVRRPEDIGLVPDRATARHARQAALAEANFTRAQALRTRAFWLLCLFTLFAYPVQAGVSLHQAPYLIERGLSPAVAATIVGTFSFMSGIASLCFGFFPRRVPIRYALTFAGARSWHRHIRDARHSDATRWLYRRRDLRHRHRRPVDAAADRLGRLLRPRQLRRGSRHRAVGPGAGTGVRPVGLRHPARLVGRL